MNGLSLDLSGKVALVIGASRGLGRESALALGQAGAAVACAARSESELQATADSIQAARSRAVVQPMDVENAEALTEGIDRVVASLGQLDILVYAAGLMHVGSALRMSLADWDRVLRINLTGGFVAARAAARHMQSRGGRMVFFGTSFVGRVLPRTLAYNVSKAGLHQLVQSLALEWARHRITVNAIAPGYFETEMPRAVLADPELRARVLARIPLGRVGDPSEIGALVTYLSSEASAFVTGAVMRIDGGQSLNVS